MVFQLVEYPEELGNNGVPTCTRQYFVELWDVGTSFPGINAAAVLTVLLTFKLSHTGAPWKLCFPVLHLFSTL